jgi:hypothetical protein
VNALLAIRLLAPCAECREAFSEAELVDGVCRWCLRWRELDAKTARVT